MINDRSQLNIFTRFHR